MAQYAIDNEEAKCEYFDEPDVLDTKVTLLAQMILNSQRMVAFTGAGISTASGIPDYSSPENSKNDAGPGSLEKMAINKRYAQNGAAVRNLKAELHCTIHS